jgi:hypothetical protein
MKVAPATNHHGGGFKDPLLFKEAELRQRASRPSSDHLCESVVAFPPKRDIRGLRTPAEGMSVARMVVSRCFGVSAFRRFGSGVRPP